jgi:hypothetical protein
VSIRSTRSARRIVTDTIRITPIESDAALSFPEEDKIVPLIELLWYLTGPSGFPEFLLWRDMEYAGL